jgi:CheY-like chemotaxis protein
MRKFKGLDCILLIDDDFLTNYVHKLAVKQTHIDTSIKDVDNVVEALEFLTHTGKYQEEDGCPRPGIIFLDINMPGLNGWDFMERYRTLDSHIKAKVIVVMLTSSLNDDDRKRAQLDDQIVLFLSKPLRPKMVLDIADQYFDPQQA